MFMLANALHGAGSTPIFTLGTSFIDENSRAEQTPFFLGNVENRCYLMCVTLIKITLNVKKIILLMALLVEAHERKFQFHLKELTKLTSSDTVTTFTNFFTRQLRFETNMFCLTKTFPKSFFSQYLAVSKINNGQKYIAIRVYV